jgi:hypothetical protein
MTFDELKHTYGADNAAVHIAGAWMDAGMGFEDGILEEMAAVCNESVTDDAATAPEEFCIQGVTQSGFWLGWQLPYRVKPAPWIIEIYYPCKIERYTTWSRAREFYCTWPRLRDNETVRVRVRMAGCAWSNFLVAAPPKSVATR